MHSGNDTPSRSFQRFTALTLAFTIGVILWGAYVRASGSGAGCGSHWPTCNGQVIPRAESIQTVIEFTHRSTSGIAFILVLVQLIWAWRSPRSNKPLRRAAGTAMLLMVTEALVGAGLVVFEMVAENKSMARGYWMIAHLLNTFALLGSLTLCWYWSQHKTSVRGVGPRNKNQKLLQIAAAALVIVAASGAIAALGDTLFPVSSLKQGLAADLSASSHVFVQLRVLHPFFAVASAIFLLYVFSRRLNQSTVATVKTWAMAGATLVLVQVATGLANLIWLAPIPLQIFHLLWADLLWICVIVSWAQDAVLRHAPAQRAT